LREILFQNVAVILEITVEPAQDRKGHWRKVTVSAFIKIKNLFSLRIPGVCFNTVSY
jgi:hypothetical protein